MVLVLAGHEAAALPPSSARSPLAIPPKKCVWTTNGRVWRMTAGSGPWRPDNSEEVHHAWCWSSILSAVFLAGGLCSGGRSVDQHGQPHVAKGTTIGIYRLGGDPLRRVSAMPGRRVSRDCLRRPQQIRALGSGGRLNEQEQEIALKFVDGTLQAHLDLRKDKGKVKHGQPDFLDVFVRKGATAGQLRNYEIWLGGQKIADPKIQVP